MRLPFPSPSLLPSHEYQLHLPYSEKLDENERIKERVSPGGVGVALIANN
jgi:hypothetical protein